MLNLPDKSKVIDSIRRLAGLAGEALFDDQGGHRFGGHSLRVAGAQMLAAAGIELSKVELLARWKSPMVLHYARMAPMQAITQDLIDRREQSSSSSAFSELKQQMAAYQDLENKVGEHIEMTSSLHP